METLEEILKLPSVDFKDKKLLPDSQGVYFLVAQSKELIYIGKTTASFRKRWKHHHVNCYARRVLRRASEYGWNNAYFRIHYLEQSQLNSAEVHELEQLLIRIFNRPLWNGVSSSKPCEPVLEMFATKTPDNLPFSIHEKIRNEARHLRKMQIAEDLYLEYVRKCNAEDVPFVKDNKGLFS